jgi:hypothetical protein
MGVFSYIYIQSFIGASRITVPYLYDLAIQHLSVQDQLELYKQLGDFIASKGH